MTLTIELSDRLAEPLKAEALAQGISPHRYVSGIVEQALSTSGRTPTVPDEAVTPVWEMIVNSMKDVPQEVLDRLPRDSAAEHDHYIYGTPKKYS